MVSALVAAWLGAVGFFAILCYGVAQAAVVIFRDATDADVQANDPAVLVVALWLGVSTIAVGAVGTWWHRRLTGRRRARMRRWADAHGWAYQPRSSLLSSRWSARGIPRARATDVLTCAGPRGEVASLTLGPAWGAASGRHAVMVVGPRRFPTLSLTPMTGRDRVERAFGGQDIAVESFAVNERWRARCADQRFAHEVLHPRLLERLDCAGVPGVCLLVQGRDVVVHVPGPTDLAHVLPLADLVLDLVSLLPAYLADDYPPFSPDVPRRERREPPRRVRHVLR